eukprot:5392548-Amphidinium_carterae.1
MQLTAAMHEGDERDATFARKSFGSTAACNKSRRTNDDAIEEMLYQFLIVRTVRISNLPLDGMFKRLLVSTLASRPRRGKGLKTCGVSL